MPTTCLHAQCLASKLSALPRRRGNARRGWAHEGGAVAAEDTHRKSFPMCPSLLVSGHDYGHIKTPSNELNDSHRLSCTSLGRPGNDGPGWQQGPEWPRLAHPDHPDILRSLAVLEPSADNCCECTSCCPQQERQPYLKSLMTKICSDSDDDGVLQQQQVTATKKKNNNSSNNKRSEEKRTQVAIISTS